jgi:carboxyl-terminal processing protease
LTPLIGQPAEQAGIKDGDLLLAVDEQPVNAGMSMDTLLALIRGPVGTQVTLRVRRGSEDLTFTITRAEIETPSIEWRMLDAAPGSAGSGNMDVGYMRQTIFSERSPREMEAAVASLREAGALRFVWDLRGNPGGLLSSAVAQADMWLDEGVIVVEERAGGMRNTFEATPGQLATGSPLIVLVDGGSASASEIVAGALREHGRAPLVGQKTFGKGSVQLIHELFDQSSLHVTNAQWYTAGGSQISGQGLEPDISVAEGDDPLAAALAALPSVQEAKMRHPVP